MPQSLLWGGSLFKKQKKKVETKLKKPPLSFKRILKLIGVGFIAAFITVIDDSLAYSSLFLISFNSTIFIILGIYMATFLQLFAIIYFSRKIAKIKYKKNITIISLIILGFLILSEII